MRLLSRPLGVVRIRWGICRRGWCGCRVIAQGHGRVVAEVIDGPRFENSRIRWHDTPPPTPDYEEPPFLPSSRMQRHGLFGLRDVHRWNLRSLPIQPLLSIALLLHAQRPAAPRRGGGPGQRAALTSRRNRVPEGPVSGGRAWSARGTHAATGTLASTATTHLNGHAPRHGHTRHPSQGRRAWSARGTHVTPPRAHSPQRPQHTSTGILPATGAPPAQRPQHTSTGECLTGS